MPLVNLPSELILTIAEHLKSSDYPGFRSYLTLRKTNHRLHTLLSFPAYSELTKATPIFLAQGLLPCELCHHIRPATYFFTQQRRDGIGPYYVEEISPDGIPSAFCIDCGIQVGLYELGDRFYVQGHGMYCSCLCCGGLGKSSLHMQICSACFDEDVGSTRRHGCHRQGQRDRMGDLLRPGKLAPSLTPPIGDWLG